MLLRYDRGKNLVYFLCLKKVKVTWTYSYKRSIILTMTNAKITFLLQKLNRYFTSSKPLFSCSLHMVFTQWYNTLFIYIISWIVNLIVYARTKVATSQNTLPIHFCLPHLSATTFYKDHICLKKRVNKCLWFLIILDLIHLANQSIPIYIWTYRYTSNTIMTPIDFMWWEREWGSVCEKPYRWCALCKLHVWWTKSKKEVEKKMLTWISNVKARPCVHQTTCHCMKYHIT